MSVAIASPSVVTSVPAIMGISLRSGLGFGFGLTFSNSLNNASGVGVIGIRISTVYGIHRARSGIIAMGIGVGVSVISVSVSVRIPVIRTVKECGIGLGLSLGLGRR